MLSHFNFILFISMVLIMSNASKKGMKDWKAGDDKRLREEDFHRVASTFKNWLELFYIVYLITRAQPFQENILTDRPTNRTADGHKGVIGKFHLQKTYLMLRFNGFLLFFPMQASYDLSHYHVLTHSSLTLDATFSSLTKRLVMLYF